MKKQRIEHEQQKSSQLQLIINELEIRTDQIEIDHFMKRFQLTDNDINKQAFVFLTGDYQSVFIVIDLRNRTSNTDYVFDISLFVYRDGTNVGNYDEYWYKEVSKHLYQLKRPIRIYASMTDYEIKTELLKVSGLIYKEEQFYQSLL